MPINKIYGDERASVWHDTEQDIIIKKFSESDQGRSENLEHYMEFQKTTDDIVKIIEIIDDTSFSMERLNMISMAHPLLAYHHISLIREHYSYEQFLKTRGKDPHWFLQTEFADLLDTGEAELLLKEFGRNELFDLIATVNNIWTKGLEYSKRLPNNWMWSCGDIKLGNIAILKNDNKLSFKLIDPNSWEVLPGFGSMETFFHTQMQLSFVTQALINKVFK